MKALKGFRDFFPENWAERRYIFETWQSVLRRYGFVEFEAPMLESTELYKKKSGDEIVGQLFNFTTRGGEDVALRPELTPSLARMVIAREADYKKPLKWFSIGRFFRYERPQEGRLREFYQLNADIIGADDAASDAELVAATIDVLREFGLSSDDFTIRLSSREAWHNWLSGKGFDEEAIATVLGVVDKIERADPERLEETLRPLGLSLQEIQDFIQTPQESHFGRAAEVLENLRARGLGDYCRLDPAVVRGLAYYTGVVFEAFSLGKARRALAGGGRYDALLQTLSDGRVNLPGIGMGMGDVVLGNVIAETPAAAELMAEQIAEESGLDIYLVIAEEDRRPDALGLIQELRDSGFSADYPLSSMKVGKQFGAASSIGARSAIVIGGEWPQVTIKNLETREEKHLHRKELLAHLETLREEQLFAYLGDDDDD